MGNKLKMKFTSNLKLMISLIIFSIMLSSFTSKANLRNSRVYEPMSYTKKELEYVNDFDDFSEKIEHVQNTGYIDVLKLDAGVKNPHINMRANVQKAPSAYRFVQKTAERSRIRKDISDDEIPLENIERTPTNTYKGNGQQKYPPGTIPAGLAPYLI